MLWKTRNAKFPSLLKQHRVTLSRCKVSQENSHWEPLRGDPAALVTPMERKGLSGCRGPRSPVVW